jgi:hypothetical protein
MNKYYIKFHFDIDQSFKFWVLLDICMPWKCIQVQRAGWHFGKIFKNLVMSTKTQCFSAIYFQSFTLTLQLHHILMLEDGSNHIFLTKRSFVSILTLSGFLSSFCWWVGGWVWRPFLLSSFFSHLLGAGQIGSDLP